jgi:drug/metabolite transporter (DMT)-like permease
MIALSIGMAAYTANDTAVKAIALHYPLGEVIFLRAIMTVVLLAVMLVVLRQTKSLRLAFSGPVLARSMCDAIASALFVVALAHMPIASLSAIALASPLIITALTVIFYHEPVGWRRWTAIAVGFAGTLLVVKPTPATFDVWALVGLCAAFGGATRDVLTRRIDPGVSTLAITFYGSLAVTLPPLCFAPFESWRLVAAPELGLMAMAALFLGFGTYLVVLAFRGVEIAVVAPFRYTMLLWAGIAGYLVFGELPDRWAMAGALLIVGSGLYALHRESVRQHLTGQQKRAAAATPRRVPDPGKARLSP